MARFTIIIFLNCLLCAYGSHHWVVTEGGRIEPKLDSAFPVNRPYDLLAVLEQEQRLIAVTDMHKRLLTFKMSVDQQWSAIELETEFEKRLYATDPNCMYANHPLSRYRLNPVFLDIQFAPEKERPKLPSNNVVSPPDCKKYFDLDFSLMTFPHLPTIRDHKNMSGILDEVESEAPLGIDVSLMLAQNYTDWTAYNLAVHYWQIVGNASNAIECARRAIYFAPREHRYLPLLNLGTLLQAVHSLGEAAIVLHMAVDLDRGQYRSHVALGHVYSYLSDYPRAAGCYENALSLRPDLVMLAKQRAAVLCHQRLITGLWAIDAALKKIVEELQEYSQLQERWMLTHTEIGLTRAIGATVAPSPDNLRTLWKAVEHQAFLLSERMTQTKPGIHMPAAVPVDVSHQEASGGCRSNQQEWSALKSESECGSNFATNKESKQTSEKEKSFRRKVSDFHSYMSQMSTRQDIPQQRLKEQIIEKLVTLEGNYGPSQPANSPYWVTLRKCVNMLDEEELLDECGQQIFAEYLLEVSDKAAEAGEGVEDLLDESTIENYVHDRSVFGSDSYHDMSEL